MNERFEKWWNEEGSGMPPLEGHDHEDHAKRISEIAWENGEYCATLRKLESDLKEGGTRILHVGHSGKMAPAYLEDLFRRAVSREPLEILSSIGASEGLSGKKGRSMFVDDITSALGENESLTDSVFIPKDDGPKYLANGKLKKR